MKTTALSVLAAATGFFLVLLLAGESAAGHYSGFTTTVFRSASHTVTSGSGCDFVKRLQDPFQRQLYMETIANDSAGGPEGEIDLISRDCMGCHDDVTAVSGGTGGRYGLTGRADGNHPIGMRYDERASRRGEFRPSGSLPQRVVLLGGRVACISCHDMTNREDFHLAVTNRGSKLCLSCHDK